MSTTDTVDLIVFGASGFTGEFVAQEISKNYPNISFAISGRSEIKLKKVHDNCIRKPLKTIIADVQDENSLISMAKQGKVVLNCVGPYRFFGLAVVEACIKANTDYCDISGEPWFIEKAEYNFNDLAVQNKVHVISACGFDSIPSDIGVEYTRNKFLEKYKKCDDEKLNSIQAYLSLQSDESLGYTAHSTTMECAVHGFSSANELTSLRKLARSKNEKIEFAGERDRCRPNFHALENDNERIAMIFPGSDKSIVDRSQQRIARNSNLNPIQYFLYVSFQNSLLTKIKGMFVGGIFSTLSKFNFGRNLLISYPYLFSGGMFSHEGPSDEQIQKAGFVFDFTGKGIDKNNFIKTRITGHDPGYVDTSALMVCAAVTILHEKSKLPDKGGVMTTAYAFRNTSLIDRLQKRNIKFEVIE